MKKLLLHEDMFFDIPNVDYKLDTELELKGPEPGEDVGVSGLLLDLIGDVAKNINDYNQLQANLENYPEVAEMIKDFADEENMKLGKIQSALKTISPNAEYIMNGAVEAEQEMDPGSPIDESLRRLNEADRPDGAPINFWEPGGEDAEEYYQTNILTDMFDADPSRFEQALEDFGYNPTNYDNFDSFLKDVDKVDLLNKFADLLQKNDELNSSWYDHFDFTEAPLPFDFDESLNESDGSWIQYYNSDVPIYSGDEQEAMTLGRKHRVSNKPLMTKDEFMDYFIDDDLAGLTSREKNDLYSCYKSAYNQKREFKDGRVFPALDEAVSDNDRWEEYYDSELQRRFYFINASGGKGEITYQDNDGNGYYRCSVWLNRRTHKYRTFNVTTSLKDAKEKVEALIDKYSDSKQESFDNEYWDSSRALDLATYCWDKGYDEDKAYQVTVAQLKKEGSALPKDLDRVKTVIYDYYDEQSGSGDDFLDESLKNHI